MNLTFNKTTYFFFLFDKSGDLNLILNKIRCRLIIKTLAEYKTTSSLESLSEWVPPYEARFKAALGSA
jgi:hypothetical protein